MKSPFDFVIEPKGNRYNNTKKVGNKYEISTISKKTGKNVLDAFSKENRQQIEKLLLAVIPGHKIMVKKLNELGKLDLGWTEIERKQLLEYKNIGDPYPNRVHNDFITTRGPNGKSILNGLETIGKFTETILEDIYINGKLFLGKEASRHIGNGEDLWHIGKNVLDYEDPEKVLYNLGHNPTNCQWMLTKNEIIIK